jgi:hypothetical protein
LIEQSDVVLCRKTNDCIYLGETLMSRITKGALFALLLSAVTAPLVAQGTYTAKSCNQSDVNAVINGPTHVAVNGDIINIPSGTCTWTSTLSVTVSITIIGSGTANTLPSQFGSGTLNTVIVDNIPSAGVIQAAVGYSSGALLRISTLDIEPVNGSTSLTSPLQIAGTCTSGGCPNIRIDNVGLGITTSWSNANDGSGQCAWLIRADSVFGVLDHNSEGTSNWPDFADIELSNYLGVGTNGDNSWAQADTTGGANNLYLENNVLYSQTAIVDTEIAPAGGAIGGARYVARFNQVTENASFGAFGDHGLDTDGRPQGGRQIEVYGNTAQCQGSSACGVLAGWRSGTGYVFGNTLTRTGSGFYQGIWGASVYRNVFTASGGWGACGGSSPYDTNDGVTYYSGTNSGSSGSTTLTDSTKSWTTNQFIPTGAPYSVYDVTQGWWAEIASNTATTLTIQSSIPEQTSTFNNGDSYQILRASVCADQPARGAGNYISGSTASPAKALSQTLDPVYEWDDTASVLGGGGNASANDTGRLIANRDWYTDNSGGSPRAQTSATSPFNGASGMGFGTLAFRPTTCTTGVGYFATDQGSWNSSSNGFGNGVLYQCSATNTWTVHYTPYSYPHPLAQGTVTTAPAAPTGLQASAQ